MTSLLRFFVVSRPLSCRSFAPPTSALRRSAPASCAPVTPVRQVVIRYLHHSRHALRLIAVPDPAVPVHVSNDQETACRTSPDRPRLGAEATIAEARFVSYLRVSTDGQGRSGFGQKAQRETVARFLDVDPRWNSLGASSSSSSQIAPRTGVREMLQPVTSTVSAD